MDVKFTHSLKEKASAPPLAYITKAEHITGHSTAFTSHSNETRWKPDNIETLQYVDKEKSNVSISYKCSSH